MRKWIGPDQARPVQDCQSVDRSSPTFPLDRTALSPTADRDPLDWWNHCTWCRISSKSLPSWCRIRQGHWLFCTGLRSSWWLRDMTPVDMMWASPSHINHQAWWPSPSRFWSYPNIVSAQWGLGTVSGSLIPSERWVVRMAYHCSSASIPKREGSGRTDWGRTCHSNPGGSRKHYLERHKLQQSPQRRRWSLLSESWEHAFLQIPICRGLVLEVGLSLLWPIVNSCAQWVL